MSSRARRREANARSLALLVGAFVLGCSLDARAQPADPEIDDDVLFESPELVIPDGVPPIDVGADLPEGATISEIAFDCDHRLCRLDWFIDDLRALTTLRPGDPLDAAELAAAAERLALTTFFASVTPRVRNLGGEVEITFELRRATVIRRVRVRSGSALGSEIRRRIFLRSGQHWTDDPVVRRRQEDVIREYFESDGFFGGSATIVAEPRSEDSVDLRVYARRGNRRTVGNIYIYGNDVFGYDDARDVLLGEFNLLRTFRSADFENAQDALLRRYRDLGFLQARVVFDEHLLGATPNTVDLFVAVEEGERWEVRFVGNRLFDDRQLLSRLGFYQTGFIDDEEIRVAVDELESAYEAIGHFFARITAFQSTSDAGVRRLTFTIDEGGPVEIRGVSFEGNTVFSVDELRALMGTQVYDLLGAGGYLQRTLLARDLASIKSAYREAGYLQVDIPRVVMVGDNAGREMYITIHISEGYRTVVDRVEIEGAEELSAESRRRLRLVSGATFTPSALSEDHAVILEDYRLRGHAFVDVSSECEMPNGETTTCTWPQLAPECVRSLDTDRRLACDRVFRAGLLVEECRLTRADPRCQLGDGVVSTEVTVRHRVEPGGRARFGRVFIRGNFETHRRAIRRELPYVPGDTFRYDLLLRGQSNIRSLRLFDSVRVQSIFHKDRDTDESVATIVIQLEEAHSRFLDHRVGFESRVTPGGDFLLILSNEPSYRDINFLGRAKELRITGNFDIDVLDSSRLGDGEFRAGAALFYIDPRFRFFGLLRDPWESRTEISYRYDLLAVPPSPLRKVFEINTRFREYFQRVRGLYLEIALSLRRTETLDQTDPDLFRAEFEPALIVSVTPRVTIDRRDNPLNPTRGTFSQFEVELADDLNVLAGVNTEKFTRFSTRHSAFVPFGRGFVFGTSVRMGFAVGGISDGFQTRDVFALPLSERFSLGGVTSLRGFSEGELTTPMVDAFGGDVVLHGAIELRYPFLRDLGVNGAVFLDGGQLARRFNELTPEGFRASTGFGVRWVIAGLLPLLVDYGVVLGRQPGERFGRLHFNIGYTF